MSATEIDGRRVVSGRSGSVFRVLCLLLLLVIRAMPTPPSVERARSLYQHGEYRAALDLLSAGTEKDATVYELIGRCYYMEGEAKAASAFFEKAVSGDPHNAVYHHWLGRAYGRRAETSSFLTAPMFASKARRSFERAVELDPRNSEAVNDLFEYYLEAPGFLGGGLDKAAALTERIGELEPAEYHYAQARLAEKSRQFQTVESHLRRAVELAPRDVGRLIDLAKFFAKQRRFKESDETFKRARTLAPDAPSVLFEQAKTYVVSRRNLDAAKRLLEQYSALSLTPEDPPRKDAEKLLARLSGP